MDANGLRVADVLRLCASMLDGYCGSANEYADCDNSSRDASQSVLSGGLNNMLMAVAQLLHDSC